MEKVVVGKIEEYDVYYLPEKDTIFCKNTAVPYDKMRIVLIERKYDRAQIKADLEAFIDGGLVELGCLTTTVENCEEINKNIKKIKRTWKRI